MSTKAKAPHQGGSARFSGQPVGGGRRVGLQADVWSAHACKVMAVIRGRQGGLRHGGPSGQGLAGVVSNMALVMVSTMQIKCILGEINPNGDNIHGLRLSSK